ncbi:MAG: pyruvate dehydrogenase (acetyl-transferring), homodimeric type [Pseudomonadales bacterium]|nr:pyruvate dehydrogenase (acetyl-transferring), homodimeric type [Pseudomonadales bacterium]
MQRFEDDLREWRAALSDIAREWGGDGVQQVLATLHDEAQRLGVTLASAPLNTPYINTIPPQDQPVYPGDVEVEKRIENINRWNAMAMVLQAADRELGVGGHIATYASCATMLEVGFNHFFRADTAGAPGDLVLPQPHAAPGVYARAFLEGRLTAEQLANYRQELAPGGGLPAYPHPRSLPSFWQLPNASMGLSTPAAIYQARFAKYLENRGLKARSTGKVWCFIGDGESDEPEVLGTINMASREQLDNLVLVINCNLQRLDGPVRGNGKIIQELERSFRGADWEVIKVIWGSGWDGLLAQDHDGVLKRRMDECLDGDYQRYSVLPGKVQREHWVEGNPALERMMNALTDEEIREIKRGGQDPKKIHAAYASALAMTGKPTVILIKTVKGDGIATAQGTNTAHQKKNFTPDERVTLARTLGIPLADEAARRAAFYKPPADSAELRYIHDRRRALGGYLPQRTVACPSLPAPELAAFDTLVHPPGERAMSTTMAMVRILSTLLRHQALGRYVVPIVPDEARTFGMDGLFKVAGIYSPEGQKYTPVDADTLLPYRESRDGQILQEGICETGAMASFMAAGTAYAMHGLPMIPFYIFYSMFGFQRVGDMIWSCGDALCRGFLLGGTAGRTTLNGEGIQHQDGHSHVLASTVPNMLCYDPAFAYEVAVIVREGIRRMYHAQEDVMVYMTLYNASYPMPAMPADVSEADILRGVYCFSRAPAAGRCTVHLLVSGALMPEGREAAARLQTQGFGTCLWSVTSYVELARDVQAVQRRNRLAPLASLESPVVQQVFQAEQGVFVAVSDYLKEMAATLVPFLPGPVEVLGTNGYGLSEDRADLRDHFEVSTAYIVQAALAALYRNGDLDGQRLEQLSSELGVDAGKVDPAIRRAD